MANAFTGVKVFFATMVADRDQLGEKVTSWMNARRDEVDISEIMVRQSSDEAFHCVSILVFYTHRESAKKAIREDAKPFRDPQFTKHTSTASEPTIETAPPARRLKFKTGG